MKSSSKVVIVGAGPAGCTLACLLAQRGFEPVVFDNEKRPDLLVGESLIPAVIPLLRRLGVEDAVAACSQRKPGASFFHGNGARVHFRFRDQGKKAPDYAYNVPRPCFDEVMRKRAEELGATFVTQLAEMIPGTEPHREIELSENSLAAAGFPKGEHPEMVIDATGRSRLFARTLNLVSDSGPRKDVAYFAHFEDFDHDEVEEGQIIISVLERGWSWRIPLKGRLSVGVVIDKGWAKELGDTVEERLENAIRTEPLLKDAGRRARRVSEVKTYSNYQLISQRGHGPGWAMTGDAFGFVDPMLSPGLFMAMKSAELMDQHLFASEGGGVEAYEKSLRQWHEAWQELIELFYDGRILRLAEAGNQLVEGKSRFNPAHFMEKKVSSLLGQMVGGTETCNPIHRKFLKVSSERLVWGVPEAETFAVQ